MLTFLHRFNLKTGTSFSNKRFNHRQIGCKHGINDKTLMPRSLCLTLILITCLASNTATCRTLRSRGEGKVSSGGCGIIRGGGSKLEVRGGDNSRVAAQIPRATANGRGDRNYDLSQTRDCCRDGTRPRSRPRGWADLQMIFN